MRRATPKPAPARRSHWTRRFHRLVGVASLVFLVLIAISGLLLNHADDLGLGNRRAASPLLLKVYGIESPPIVSSFSASGLTFASTPSALYANGRELLVTTAPLRGAVAGPGSVIVATAEEILVTTPDGMLIERFDPDISGPLLQLGASPSHFVLRTSASTYALDAEGMTVSELIRDDGDVAWSLPSDPSDEQVERIALAAIGSSLSWERVLADLHSGRILPSVGRYLADITALCLLYLSVTGAIMWFRLQRNGALDSPRQRSKAPKRAAGTGHARTRR